MIVFPNRTSSEEGERVVVGRVWGGVGGGVGCFSIGLMCPVPVQCDRKSLKSILRRLLWEAGNMAVICQLPADGGPLFHLPKIINMK